MTIEAAPAAIDVATTRFFINLRFASRVMTAAIAGTAVRLPLGLIITATLLCLLYDLFLARRLRRRPVPYALRLPLDCADVALWCTLTVEPVDAPALLACPLALDTALRGRRTAFVVVLLVGGTANAALLVTGGAAAIAPVLWPGAGALGGWIIGRYVRHQLRQRLRVAEAEREASVSRARLAGQSSVAFGHDTVVDQATRVWPLLAGTGPVPRSPLAAWRQRLAEGFGEHEFLGTALRNWQTLHNSEDADLSRDVDFRIREGDGAMVLVPSQVALLGQVLKEMRLRGPVTVSARGPAAALGRERRLIIAGRLVRLAADQDRTTKPYDPGPLILGLGAVGSLGHCLPSFEAVPLPAGLALAVIGLMMAWWAHTAVAVWAAAAHPRVLRAALIFATLDAVTSTLLMQNVSSGGLTRAPFLHFLLFIGPIAVFYWPGLPASRRWRTIGVCAGIVAVGVALSPVAPHPRDVVILVWPALFTVGATDVRGMLDQDTAELKARIAARHQAAVEDAHAQGRAEVFRLVEADVAEAERRLRRYRDHIDPFLAGHAAERLADIRRRLDRTRPRQSATTGSTSAPTP
ncbi:hypothetical protein HII36_37575 [Nonomuraea sp. NN258]|uniref:hypothetical protein n=1 Tax=Nonomuraea antri TaxID=2730852 RepID=UPI001568CE5A|nr:hypothetical protein [Nonomuraea antri]NRQ37502.1 hypothetical protein [Nonomuraea antri]